MTEVERLLDCLEEEIRSGKKSVFAGSGLKQVDEFKCLEYVNQIRNMLPSTLSEARVVLQDKNDILENARGNANAIIAQAQDQARRMVEEHAIIASAQKEAEDIRNEAIGYADRVVKDTYDYLCSMTDDAYAKLNEAVQAVIATRRDLDSKMR